MKRLLAQAISRLVVFGIMCIGTPLFITYYIAKFLLSIGTDPLTVCLCSGGYYILITVLFVIILGLSIED